MRNLPISAPKTVFEKLFEGVILSYLDEHHIYVNYISHRGKVDHAFQTDFSMSVKTKPVFRGARNNLTFHIYWLTNKDVTDIFC